MFIIYCVFQQNKSQHKKFAHNVPKTHLFLISFQLSFSLSLFISLSLYCVVMFMGIHYNNTTEQCCFSTLTLSPSCFRVGFFFSLFSFFFPFLSSFSLSLSVFFFSFFLSVLVCGIRNRLDP
eukprot:m.203402 g.203402  ORF g.203402 m.203402 type:complete len:122 (+) comp13730_c1_seq1:456-821(+)